MSNTDGVNTDVAGACPIPLTEYPVVTLAHGGGGRLSQMLTERLFVSSFASPQLATLHDGAVLSAAGARLAFSTDSFVVHPLFFPGGDIGSLAVFGTVNDVAMCGARPLWLAASFILEEGLPMDTLWRIVRSMAAAAAAADVAIVTGDTKVVERGKADGLFVTTAGVGLVPENVTISPTRATPGDVILLSGDIAAHGVAVMSTRQGLAFETALQSDCAPLAELVSLLLRAGHDDSGGRVHVLRDPTRGGVASALNEIAQAARVGMRLQEQAITMRPEVRGACELLGLDPLYVANEGKCLAIVAPDAADDVLAAMRDHPLGRDAARVGEVTAEHPGKVVLRTALGSSRVVEMLSGEQLPRIC